MKSLIKVLGVATACLFIVNTGFAKNRITGTTTGESNGNKSMAAGCVPASSSTELDLNNVRATIHTGGDMWWNLVGAPRYEVPVNSGKHALFAGAIWIGGTDVNGQLRLCAQMHRGSGNDYWPGPLVTTGSERANVTADVCNEYDKHWVISREEVELFRAWFNADEETRANEYGSYEIPTSIINWPAHGDVSNGYDFYLAPFRDVDGDGYYNYNNGDYPFYDLDGILDCGTTQELRRVRLYGDKTLWWVYNDKGNAHTETGGAAIGMEIRAQAFAFSTNDELNNMTFYNYEVINRSTYTLENCYFGVWTDADMGDPEDDYIGCDVARGLGYLYNGDNADGDGNGNTYGTNPPAVGVDFFEGPYQDPDGKDNLSSWAPNHTLNCDMGYGYVNAAGEPDKDGTYQAIGPVDLNEGNINGLNFGDGRIDNERWGMRRFIYFMNPSYNNPPGPITDPGTAVQYYNYLTGYWKDGTRMTYGTNGYNIGSGYTEADFMFPWDPYGVENTDKCGWGTEGVPQTQPWAQAFVNNQVGDMRFIQSAGPFTLDPGMVNDITVGVVWARSSDGYRESVAEVRRADEKAQRLFENCFKVVNGPDAPELTAIPLDKEIILHIWNKETSNNFAEKYVEEDFNIVCPSDLPLCDMNYRFQGYQVYQLKDKSTSISEITDITKARLVFQCDIKDEIDQIVNFEWSEDLGANVPTEMVKGRNEGISHTFTVKEDQFAIGNKTLVNNKSYYFIAIAYGFNQYREYIQDLQDGQKKPYLAGRKAAEGSITPIEVRPNIVDPRSGGTILNSKYGDGVEITRLEGLGTGHNYLELTDETVDEILSGPPWKAKEPKYKPGYGPVEIKIVDPLNVIEQDYILRFDSDSVMTQMTFGYFKDIKWFVYPEVEDQMEVEVKVPINLDGVDTSYVTSTVAVPGVVMDFARDNRGHIIVPVSYVERKVYPPSTVYCDSTILFHNEQLINDWGISIKVVQVDIPIKKDYLMETVGSQSVNYYIENNGYIGSNAIFKDSTSTWLYGVPDDDDCSAFDWIKSGTSQDEQNPECNDFNYSGRWADNLEDYESILGGTWAPYLLADRDNPQSENQHFNGVAFYEGAGTIDLKYYRLSSVDVVITKDRTKWSRCPVFEMCENDTTETSMDDQFIPGPSEGGVYKFDLRAARSIDKDGNFADTSKAASTNEDDAEYLNVKHMGWFPGYAIDVETGERLNIGYGEDSWLGSEHGRDMMWNPTYNWVSNLGDILFGGKHNIYVFGHNGTNYDETKAEWMPAYDGGAYIVDMLKPEGPDMTVGCYNRTPALRKRYIWKNAMWASIPILLDRFEFKNYDSIPSDVTIQLRVASPYWKGLKEYAAPDTVINGIQYPRNDNYPMFRFSTKGMAPVTQDQTTAESALDLIRVVPNPYYAHNSYEETQLDYKVKITNLPQQCKISIFSVNGTLIRQFNKDSDITWQDWNLKNEYGILISSGVYIVHIDAPGIGEKVVKWFAAMRPMDMNNF